MNDIRVKKGNVDEAIDEALELLKATIDEVEIEVIDKGYKKFGGLIKKEADVLVKLKEEVTRERNEIEKEKVLRQRQLEEAGKLAQLKQEREEKEKIKKTILLRFIEENKLNMPSEDEIFFIKDSILHKNRIETIHLIRKSFKVNVEKAHQIEKMLDGGSLI